MRPSDLVELLGDLVALLRCQRLALLSLWGAGGLWQHARVECVLKDAGLLLQIAQIAMELHVLLQRRDRNLVPRLLLLRLLLLLLLLLLADRRRRRVRHSGRRRRQWRSSRERRLLDKVAWRLLLHAEGGVWRRRRASDVGRRVQA